MTFSEFKSALQTAINNAANANSVTNTTDITGSAGEAITDAAAGILDTVNTVSPDNVQYPKTKS